MTLMKMTDFFHQLHDVLQRDGFSFFFDERAFETPQQMSSNKQLLCQCLSVLTCASVGLPTLLFAKSKFYEQHGRDTLVADLKRLQRHCDLIAIKDSFGSCLLMSPVTPKPASRGRIKTGHSEVL